MQYTKDINKKYQISLKLPNEIKANNNIDIVFGILNTAGYPITDLQPLMGAGGHCVIISSNIREFLHVHPIKEVDANWKGEPNNILEQTFQFQVYIKFGDNFNINLE